MPENTTIQPSPVIESQTPVSHISAGDVARPYELLGRSLDQIGEGFEKVATPLAEKAGYEAVSTDDQGNMTVNRLPILGPAGAAYSRALKVSALAQADGAAARQDIEISKQFPNDPEAYLVAANKFRDTTVKQVTDAAGPEVGTHLSSYIDSRTTLQYRRLLNEQQATIKHNFDKDTQWAIESKSEQLISLCKNGGCDTPEAKGLITEIHAILGERANNGILAAPKSESDRVTTKLNADIEGATFEHKVGRVLANPAAPYQSMYETAANKYGLDPTLLTRQGYQESGFHENSVSPAGARGIAQFMPETARRYGVNVRDPQSSIEGQAHYMSDLSRMFGGNTGLALAGYNWGENNVAAWMAAGANPARMPRETRNYVQSITGQSIEAWVAGERPSPFAMRGVPTGTGGTQKALDMVEAERRNNPDKVQGQLNYERGLAAIKDYHDEVTRRTNLASLGQKAADEAFETQIIADQASANPAITENDIKTAPGVSPESKMRMIRFVNRVDMPEPLTRVSEPNEAELYKRINLPEGDPGKITSTGEIIDRYNNRQLTSAARDRLLKNFSDVRNPQNERLSKVQTDFLKSVEPSIDSSNPLGGMIKPAEKLKMYEYSRMVDDKVAEYRKAGKNPHDLFDPSKPDYLGKAEVISRYQIPLQQGVQQVTRQWLSTEPPVTPGGSTVPPIVQPTQAAPATAPIQPSHNPGEPPGDYIQRITSPK